MKNNAKLYAGLFAILGAFFFFGCSDDSETVEVSDPETVEVIKNHYAIVLDANGGVMEESEYVLNQTEKSSILPSAESLGLKRPGYSFLGWGNSKDATEVLYSDGAECTLTQSVILYAIWKELDFTITYEANGGTWSSNAMQFQSVQRGKTIVLPKASTIGLSKENYSFLGWSTNSDSTEAEYFAGDLLESTADITLYAIWYKKGDVLYATAENVLNVIAAIENSTTVVVTGELPSDIVRSIGDAINSLETAVKISLDLSDTVGCTYIQPYGFKNCLRLSSILLPNTITVIYAEAFHGCSSLETINIPNGVTKIDYRAFYGCSSLESIAIPDSVTEIDDGTFTTCSSLESVNIPNGVTEIGHSAFFGCSSLKSITIPNSVTIIDNVAFSCCSNLESVTILDGVTKIGSDSFDRCSSLKSISIPDSVTEIGSCAFAKCSSLESVTISNSVTIIDGAAFEGCSSLSSITIPDSVKKICGYAFYKCEKLGSAFFEKTEGWKEGDSVISSSDLQNTATAAQLLRNSRSDWTRS